MNIEPLAIPGAYLVTPRQHADDRGRFLEWYRFDHLADAIGHPLELAQSNISISTKGVVRGIHFADVPPSQAKYLTCVRGEVLDVVVDIRVGSPAYGRHEAIRLDEANRRAVYVAEGLGHGFCALTDDATLVYLCTQTYTPGREHGVHPLDPELGIDWQVADPRLSDKDVAAPTLAEAAERGMLPDYAACQKFYAELGS
ncbi:MAG: dTDP-4-dehydrorhamnose 3,5-epimerase [Micromonosporaceae bacterium]